MNKIIIGIVAFCAALGLGTSVEATKDKVWVCHAVQGNGELGNGYNLIRVDASAVDGEGKNDHTHHEGDIIPAPGGADSSCGTTTTSSTTTTTTTTTTTLPPTTTTERPQVCEDGVLVDGECSTSTSTPEACADYIPTPECSPTTTECVGICGPATVPSSVPAYLDWCILKDGSGYLSAFGRPLSLHANEYIITSEANVGTHGLTGHNCGPHPVAPSTSTSASATPSLPATGSTAKTNALIAFAVLSAGVFLVGVTRSGLRPGDAKQD